MLDLTQSLIFDTTVNDSDDNLSLILPIALGSGGFCFIAGTLTVLVILKTCQKKEEHPPVQMSPLALVNPIHEPNSIPQYNIGTLDIAFNDQKQIQRDSSLGEPHSSPSSQNQNQYIELSLQPQGVSSGNNSINHPPGTVYQYFV